MKNKFYKHKIFSIFMACDMCGSHSQLFSSLIEGVKLNVCSSCSRHGKVISSNKIQRFEKPTKRVKNKETVINDTLLKQNYGDLIRNSREGLGLKQEELAAKLSIKESLLRGIENNKIEPPIELAKKLEVFLGIRLIEEVKIENSVSNTSKPNILTIGDLIKKDG